MNAPGLRHPVVMRVLSDFYWRLPVSSKHASVGIAFLGLGIESVSQQCCMSLRVGTNNIVGSSINQYGHLGSCFIIIFLLLVTLMFP